MHPAIHDPTFDARYQDPIADTITPVSPGAGRPSAEPSGSVRTSEEPGHHVVWLQGEIDLAVAAELAGLLVRACEPGWNPVLDCSQLTFCDATLANFIAALSEQAAVTVRRPTSLLMEVLEICGLSNGGQLVRPPSRPAVPA